MSNVTCKSFPDHPEDCVSGVIGPSPHVFPQLWCIFVIFVMWLYGRYSVLAQRLILSLTIAALLDGLGRLFQDATNEHSSWCTFQAFWLNYINYAVMLWVLCITFNLFMNVVRNITTSKFEKWYHGVCWGVSLVISLVPLIGSRYGPSGSWCWIVNDTAWQMSIWYVPLIVVIIALLIVYSYIVITMLRKANNWTQTYNPESRQAQLSLKEDIKPLRLYPFVFLLLSIFPLVNRIQNATSDGHHVLALVILHAISASVQGAVYAVVFAVDRDTLRSLTYTQMKFKYFQLVWWWWICVLVVDVDAIGMQRSEFGKQGQLLKKFAPPTMVQEYPLEECGTGHTREDGTQEARY